MDDDNGPIWLLFGAIFGIIFVSLLFWVEGCFTQQCSTYVHANSGTVQTVKINGHVYHDEACK